MRISDDLNEIRLLPIHVEAALFGTKKAVSMANINENYNSLRSMPAGNGLESQPFTGMRSQEVPGVHLHFILPEEFTHGSQREEGGDIVYPDFPNRWTVTRISVLEREGSEPVLTRRNWILESDFLSMSPMNGSQYSAVAYDDPKIPYRFLGRLREYDGVISSPGEHFPHLSAVSTGKPYFTGYYPECKNVLGCYDDLSDVEIREGTKDFARLTYIVSGWVENENPADHTVCHGIVTQIRWMGVNGQYETGIPSGTNMPNAAVGNSLEEAAAALCSYYLKQPEMEKVLEHLFFGTLSEWEKLDGALEGEKKIKQFQFRPVSSPKEVKIQAKEDAFLRERQELMEEISECRQRLQEYEEQRKEQCREIYLLWRKYAMCRDYLESAKKGIFLRIEKMEALNIERQKEAGREQEMMCRLQSLLKKDESLLETAGERYWQPKDLTFLLEGADQSSIYKRLENYKVDGKIPERARNQIIRQAQMKIPGVTEGEEIRISGKELLTKTTQFKEQVLEELVEEGMLIAEGCRFYTAHSLLCHYGKKEDARILSHVVVEMEKCLSCEENLNGGRMPSPIGNYVWEPSWNPLILEWSMKYYPDPDIKTGDTSMKNWSLREMDYDYTGSEIGHDFFEVVMGRSILSPYGPDYLSKMFGRFLSDEKYKDIAGKLAGMNILSQTLEGFHDNLITRRDSTVVAPWMNKNLDPELTAIAARVSEGLDLYEDVNQATINQRKPEEAFYPVRAGLAQIDRVRVVDSFGRVLKYDLGDVIVPESLRMKKELLTSRFLLRPRILAPMRVQSQWNMEESGIEGEVSPVYGWIWANLLDSCLHIYHPDGTMACSIQNTASMDGSGRYKVSLRNPPGGTKREEELLRQMGPNLRGFTEGLLDACKKDSKTLYEFLKSLDESMWTSRSGGSTAQEEVLAYLGRPLALAGIQIKLDMKGDDPKPMYYTDGEKKESLLQQLEVPLRIGDKVSQTDGTVGFYVHGDGDGFRVFHRCQRELKRDADVPYIDDKTTLSMKTVKEAPPVSVTVLFHPAGKISMTTGLLPVKEMKLLDAWTEKAMKNMFLTLYYGPFLTPGSQLQMFLPKAMEKEWSFLSFERPGEKKTERDIMPPWMGTDQEEEWKQIMEGWLLLGAGTTRKG